MKTIHLGLKILLTILIIPYLAMAQDDGPGPGRDGPGGRGGRRQGFKQLFSELNLTPEQREELRSMRESRQATRAKRESLKAAREQLITSLKSDATTEAEALAQVELINRLSLEVNQARIKNLFKLKSTLSPDQFSKLRSAMEHRRGKNGSGGGHGGSRFGG